MQILFTPFRRSPRLERYENEPFSPGVEAGPGPRDNRDSYERFVATEAPGVPEPDGPFRRLADAVLGYQVFPSWLVNGVLRRTPVEVGDAVGIRYHFCPGFDFFFAARVYERFDEQAGEWWRAGFSYRTLRGHPETGEETFSVEKEMATGRVRVALRSWSRPGIFLAKLGYPLTRRIQKRASAAALDHLEEIAHTPALVATHSPA